MANNFKIGDAVYLRASIGIEGWAERQKSRFFKVVQVYHPYVVVSDRTGKLMQDIPDGPGFYDSRLVAVTSRLMSKLIHNKLLCG